MTDTKGMDDPDGTDRSDEMFGEADDWQEAAAAAYAAAETSAEGPGWPERHTGPVIRRRGQVQSGTTDQRLLDSRGSTDWVHSDPWRVLRIQSEFVEGFGALAELGPAVSVFGSARTPVDSREYDSGVRIGRALAEAGLAVITGGGPGAMEAVNLGARLGSTPDALDDALARLANAPEYRAGTAKWARPALDIAAEFPAASPNLGVPTWFYGQEPPNAFATRHAKYFSNALREDVLLTRCRGGLIVLPGEAGTVQEVFQAATRNYYAAHEDLVTPFILVGRHHWTETLPVWSLLQSLGAGRAMGRHIYLVDTVDEAVESLQA